MPNLVRSTDLKQRTQNQIGFTLIELIVVISIIVILGIVGVTVYTGVTKSVRDSKRVADLKQISTALQLFYYQYGRFPASLGAATWDEHWKNFSDCLESGTACGFTIPGTFQPVMQKVPQEPLDDPATFSDEGLGSISLTYFTGWEGRTPENFLLRAKLETNDSALQHDADGGWRNATDGYCDDPWFCIKYNWPW